MARIDDYQQARQLAIEALAKTPLEQIGARSGFEVIADGQGLMVPFLNRTYRISYPDFTFCEPASDQDIPIQEQVLILHYLKTSAPPEPQGQWVSYREIRGASFYFSAFFKRAINPLQTVFGQNSESFSRAARKLSGKPIEPGDAGFEFRVFPRVPVQIILWRGDDEFPPQANILFDKTIEETLSPEDVAWMGGMLVYRLMALSKSA